MAITPSYNDLCIDIFSSIYDVQVLMNGYVTSLTTLNIRVTNKMMEDTWLALNRNISIDFERYLRNSN